MCVCGGGGGGGGGEGLDKPCLGLCSGLLWGLIVH